MRLKTFYEIYYRHRIKKSSLILKIYILILLPINFLINKILLEKRLNLDLFSKKNLNLYDKDFNFLVEYFNSDKGKKYLNQYQKPISRSKRYIEGHFYDDFYEKFFSKKRRDIKNILEIGAFKGNGTAAFFFYFSNAEIISGDIFQDIFRYKSKRIKNFYFNNSKENELDEKIIKKDYKFDIIIEDAGHYLKDQIISLFTLFQTLRPKGIFVIEELEFPNTRQDMNLENERPTLKDILISIKKNKDFTSRYVTQAQKKYFLENLERIEIFQGKTSEIAFIEKK